jgi:hypothetical protein
VWAIVAGLAVVALLHFRLLRATIFHTPSKCALVFCSCVAASLVLLRFLLSADVAYRGSACFTLRSTALEFSCTGPSTFPYPFKFFIFHFIYLFIYLLFIWNPTDDSLTETMVYLRGAAPIPEWRDVARAASARSAVGYWAVRAVEALSPGFKYAGLCVGVFLLLLPDLIKRNAHALIRRFLLHPFGKVRFTL